MDHDAPHSEELSQGLNGRSDEPKSEWQEPKLTFIEPRLTQHGELTKVTGQFFGGFSPGS
jgi:hypothetical protein